MQGYLEDEEALWQYDRSTFNFLRKLN